jgi:hypothetical protein
MRPHPGEILGAGGVCSDYTTSREEVKIFGLQESAFSPIFILGFLIKTT